MHWNHRVVKRVWYPGTDREEITYGIHEAYYGEDGLVCAITENPVEVVGENIDSMRQTLKWMQECLEKPILDYDNIPEEGAKDYFDGREDGWRTGLGATTDVDPSL